MYLTLEEDEYHYLHKYPDVDHFVVGQVGIDSLETKSLWDCLLERNIIAKVDDQWVVLSEKDFWQFCKVYFGL